MTLIIRSDKTLTAPNRTAVTPPNFGVSDLLAYWSAGSAPGAAAAPVTTVPSSISSTQPLAPTLGTPALGETGTTRWLNMRTSADDRLSPAAALTYPGAVTVFMLARWAHAVTGSQRVTALAGTAGGFIIQGNGSCVLESSGGTVNGAWPPPAANTWHRVIGVINGASSSITTDGVKLTGTAGAVPASGIPLLRGTTLLGVDFICHGIIGHAATAAEITKIDAALAALIPA